jgi:hypothetical protein
MSSSTLSIRWKASLEDVIMLPNSKNYHNLLYLIITVGSASLGLALLCFAYIGTFSRYYADDYCISGSVVANGFWKAQVASYIGWSNRYAATFFTSLSDMFGRYAIRVWPGLIMMLLLLSLIWTFRETAHSLRLEFSSWATLPIAAVIVFLVVLGSPQRYQTVYWRMGLFTYTLPLVFLICLIGLVIHLARKTAQSRHRLWAWMFVCGVLAFIAGGFSETYLMLQVGLLGLTTLGVWFFIKGEVRSRWLPFLISSLVGSLLALAVVLAAPGNVVRQANMPPSPDLAKLANLSLKYAWDFIRYSVKGLPIPTFFCFLYVSLLAWFLLSWHANNKARSLSIRRLLGAVLITLVAGYLVIVCTVIPSVYAESAYPEARALMVSYFVLACMVVIIGWLAGWIAVCIIPWNGSYVRWGVVLALFLLSVYPFRMAWKAYLEIPAYQTRAALWDTRDSQINLMQGQGLLNIEIPGMDSANGLMEMNDNPATWVNVCAAQFYGVDSFKATP